MPTIYWPFDTSTVSEWCGAVNPAVRDGVHMGTDFAVAQGTELRATIDGVIKTYRSSKDGWGIDIIQPDGFRIRNWHMSEIRVSDGQTVTAGQIIGLTGGARGTVGAGNSTGPHLHWELRTDASFQPPNWIDPRTLPVKTFGQETPAIDLLENNKMVTLVQTSDNGWAYIWNMATDQVQNISSDQEFIALQQIFPVFKTANMGEFNISRDKYRDIFKVC